MNDDLDPELKSLFASETDDPPPDAVRGRLASALAASLVLPVPPPAAVSPPAALGKAMVSTTRAWLMASVAFVAGGAAGVGWTTAHAPAAAFVTPQATRAPMPVEAPPPPPVAEISATDATDAAPPTSQFADAGTARGSAASRPLADAATDLAAERALLDDAQAAVNAHRPDEALRMVGEHATRFPRGQLWEEREALAIDALVESGEPGKARARAAKLRARSPHSLVLPAVDAALQSIP